MNQKQFNHLFFDFLKHCSTPFQTVEHISLQLKKAGFQLLCESEEWKINDNSGYYCLRDDGSIIAFKTAARDYRSVPWKMTGAHSDSPSLQIKPNPLRGANSLNQLCVEVYGGPLLTTWFDRDLGIAGRVSLLSGKNTLLTRSIDFKRAMAIIPSVAIHLDRTANKDHTVEKQKQLYPLLFQSVDNEISFEDILSKQLQDEYPDLAIDRVLDYDLFCYDTQKPAFVGLNNDFIAASRLDNLVSCFVSMQALLQKKNKGNCLFLCSNHEEIGSASVAGAQGTFLFSVLKRLLKWDDLFSRQMNYSYFLSLDNAHAAHPNFQEKHDPQHLPQLNQGPVIKYNSNQRYATTSKSAALYKFLCSEIDIPVQSFVMNNDLACGSTIGPIAATKLGVQTVDIGVPSLAMHSIRETTGSKDPFMLYQTISHFFNRKNLPLFKN